MPIEFDPAFPLPTLLVTIAGLVAFVLTTYPQRVRHLPRGRRRLMIGLRLATVFVLLLTMLRPAIPTSDSDEEKLVLLVLADRSRSMQTPDGPGGITRREALLDALSTVEPQWKELEDRIEIRRYDFDEELRPTDELGDETDGLLTRIGPVLKQLFEETNAGERYLGALLLTDGAERGLPSDEADARQLASQLGRQRDLPVYAIGYGSETISGTTKDVIVENLLVDPLVFEKKAVPVTVDVEALGVADQNLTVRLLVEDRTGIAVGETGPMVPPTPSENAIPTKVIRTTENQETIPVELSFVPTEAGSFKIAVEVTPLDGELRTSNNRQETIITVRKGGLTVAYFDTLRAEQKFLRAVNGFDQIQLDYYPVRYGGIFSTKIDPALFEAERYDVYIIGDVPARVFGEKNLLQLAGRLDNGAGLLMIGGPHTFGHGGWGETIVDRYLPVRVSQDGEDFTQPLQMIPTRKGLRNFIMRLDTDANNLDRWRSLAPLSGGNRLVGKTRQGNVLSDVLAVGIDPAVKGTPAEANAERTNLLFAWQVGSARIIAFAADTTFQWYVAGQQTEHQRFWQNVILWLAKKENDADQPVWVRVDPKNFTPRQPVPIEFGARDAENEPILGAEYTIEIYPPGEETPIRVVRTGSAAANLYEWETVRDAGDYRVSVSATKEGTSLGPVAWSRFLIDDRDIELENPVSDRALLEDLAQLSGGAVLTPEAVKTFVEQKLDEVDDLELERLTPLWDHWGMLLLLVALLCTEWFLRKRNDLV